MVRGSNRDWELEASVQLPFTTDQFLEVIARYNAAVSPMPFLFYGLAALLIFWGVRSSRMSDRWVGGTLAGLWAWMAVVYNWLFFTDINPAAWLFGGLFLVQAVVFLVAGVTSDRLSLRFRPDLYGITGGVFLAYGLVVYPILGALAGHGYPQGPTFGLPCPTTIATFGLLLWSVRRVPWWVMVVPTVWALIGTSAAFQFGMPEDYGLFVAGVGGIAMIALKNRRLARSAPGNPVPA